jgi:branched-chain amino acid aminotransferase
MLDERMVYVNGSFVKWPEAMVHMMCHSFARGSTIFEVISFYATKSGPAVFRLWDHVERLFKTAELLDMELPYDREALCRAVVDTVRHNRLGQGVIKVVGYYPQFAFEIQPPTKKLDLAVFVFDPAEDIEGFGVTLDVSTTAGISRWRKLDPQTIPIEAKAAANYLNGMIAHLDVRKRGFKDAIMLDTQGFIAEGATESIFLVRDGRIMTPSLGTVLDSITRRSILHVSRYFGIESFEGRLRPELLYEAEEVFFASTPFKILPVSHIEDREMPSVPGPVQAKLAGFLQKITSGAEEDFKDWLYLVD